MCGCGSNCGCGPIEEFKPRGDFQLGVPVLPVPLMGLVKTRAGTGNITLGSTETFTLTLTNSGTGPTIISTIVTDIVPANFNNVAIVSASSGVANVVGNTVTWTVPTGLAVGSPQTVVFTADAASTGTGIVNNADATNGGGVVTPPTATVGPFDIVNSLFGPGMKALYNMNCSDVSSMTISGIPISLAWTASGTNINYFVDNTPAKRLLFATAIETALGYPAGQITIRDGQTGGAPGRIFEFRGLKPADADAIAFTGGPLCNSGGFPPIPNPPTKVAVVPTDMGMHGITEFYTSTGSNLQRITEGGVQLPGSPILANDPTVAQTLFKDNKTYAGFLNDYSSCSGTFVPRTVFGAAKGVRLLDDLVNPPYGMGTCGEFSHLTVNPSNFTSGGVSTGPSLGLLDQSGVPAVRTITAQAPVGPNTQFTHSGGALSTTLTSMSFMDSNGYKFEVPATVAGSNVTVNTAAYVAAATLAGASVNPADAVRLGPWVETPPVITSVVGNITNFQPTGGIAATEIEVDFDVTSTIPAEVEFIHPSAGGVLSRYRVFSTSNVAPGVWRIQLYNSSQHNLSGATPVSIRAMFS